MPASSVPQDPNQLSEFLLRACHDLRGPLRAIRTHTELLRRATPPAPGEDRGPLDFVIEGSINAGLLIDGLTDYSLALQIDPGGFMPVGFGIMLRTAMAKLAPWLKENQTAVTYTDLPTLPGNGDRIVQLFELLIDQAVRRRVKGAEVTIHVSAEQRDSDWLFHVRDNAKPVDSDLLERMFKPFERIHSNQRPGPGMATCRIIVERHGGSMWAEPGGVSFNWPKP